MSRNFERSAISVPNARNMPAYLIRCSKCGGTEKVSTNTFGGSTAAEGLAARFRNKGWSVSTRDGGDVCPSCQERKRPQKCEGSNVVEMSIKAVPPREMSKEEQRIIFAEINDVYLDEKTGYSSGWNDKKVAEKLGVPVAWVKQVRDAHFGKEGAGEDVLAGLASLRSDFKSALTAVDAANKSLVASANATSKAIVDLSTANGLLQSLGKRIDALEKSVGEATR